MLQFIAGENDRFSIPELVQMAIEGGCKWVQLHLPGLDDEHIRAIGAEVVPLCRETETILTIEDHIDLARELGIHGVHLTAGTMNPYDVREMLGPEAIIGVQVDSAAAVLPLRNLDIDYVTFASMPLDALTENVSAIRDAGIEMPIVASGDIAIDSIAAYIGAGCSGLALGATIADAPDPVAATALALQALG